MQVCDVWDKVEKAGLPNHANDEINATLTRMGKGKFSLKEKFELAVVGVSTKDMQDMANCAKQIVDQDFNGDAKGALAFMKKVHQSGIARLDFNELVHKGVAHRLVGLSKTDPAAFDKVISGKYTDVAELNTAVGGPQMAARATIPQLKAQTATLG